MKRRISVVKMTNYNNHKPIRVSGSACAASLCCSGCVWFSTIGILVVVAVITQKLNITFRRSSLPPLVRMLLFLKGGERQGSWHHLWKKLFFSKQS